jgi:hypothetical protein
VTALAAGRAWPVGADDSPALEYQVKAAFLVKFAAFVTWPAEARAAEEKPFTIGILGEDPFGKGFDGAVQRERINHRPVRLRRAGELGELADCQVIFISAGESKRLQTLLQELDSKPVLVVGDEADFAKRGGMIGFVKEGGKVRFEVNRSAAERAGLKLSAKLLQIGKIIVPGKSRAGG